MKPRPPNEARDKPPRPGGLPRSEGEDAICIPASEFHDICKQLRTNVLMGAAAADALEAAAGLSEPASPPGSKSKELRCKVAGAREDADDTDEKPKEEEKPKKPKKKAMMFAEEEPEEIPEKEEEEAVAEKEEEPEPAKPEGEEEPELNLNPKQNKMRTDLEMWVMDEIPGVFGVDDSEELAEKLQEDGQALKITQLIAETSTDKQKANLEAWLADAPAGDKDTFVTALLEKVTAIQEAGAKKKKKKKKVDAE